MKLEHFLNQTENVKAELSVTALRSQIQYPFLYVEKLTRVELQHLVAAGVLQRNGDTPNAIGLYLKSDGFKLLGYVELNFETIIRLNYLSPHKIYMKANKETVQELQASILDSLLLT